MASNRIIIMASSRNMPPRHEIDAIRVPLGGAGRPIDLPQTHQGFPVATSRENHGKNQSKSRRKTSPAR